MSGHNALPSVQLVQIEIVYMMAAPKAPTDLTASSVYSAQYFPTVTVTLCVDGDIERSHSKSCYRGRLQS